MKLRLPIIAAACASLVSACAVGPDFKTPESTAPSGYTAEPLPSATVAPGGPAGAAQTIALGRDLPDQWWTLFHCQTLDELVRQSLAANPSLAAAQASLRAARENLSAGRGSLLLPSVNGTIGGTRERASPVSTGLPRPIDLDVYQAALNVSYTIDVFGGARRQVEGLEAEVDYQNFELEAAYLTLTSNVVAGAIREAGLRAQIKATEDLIAAQARELDLVRKQFRFGAVARSTVLAQESQLAATQAQLPALHKALEQNRDQLAALSGHTPDSARFGEFRLEDLTLPAELPVSLPSEVAHQRPDIRADEALLHLASANVGVATANQYPQFTITGSVGREALEFHKLTQPQAGIWSLTGGIAEPLFNGGALAAKKRAASAQYDAAFAQYQQTVLTAFAGIADALRAIEFDARSLEAQAQYDRAAREALDLTDKQYRLGAVNFLNLLDAQRSYQQAHIALVEAQAARYADTVTLFQQVGGGWWTRTTPIAQARPDTNPTSAEPASHNQD